MLVLSRRVGESIVIGENMDIIVTVHKIDNNQVKITIDAPKDVPVHRDEIAKRILRERSAKKEGMVDKIVGIITKSIVKI
jgi:carbon storage regulator